MDLRSWLAGTPFQVEPFEPIEQAIDLGIAAFSILLLALSLSAYRHTGIRRILYASAAFGLFAVQRLFEYLEDISPELEPVVGTIVVPGLTLAILVLFFLAIVSKR